MEKETDRRSVRALLTDEQRRRVIHVALGAWPTGGEAGPVACGPSGGRHHINDPEKETDGLNGVIQLRWEMIPEEGGPVLWEIWSWEQGRPVRAEELFRRRIGRGIAPLKDGSLTLVVTDLNRAIEDLGGMPRRVRTDRSADHWSVAWSAHGEWVRLPFLELFRAGDVDEMISFRSESGAGNELRAVMPINAVDKRAYRPVPEFRLSERWERRVLTFPDLASVDLCSFDLRSRSWRYHPARLGLSFNQLPMAWQERLLAFLRQNLHSPDDLKYAYLDRYVACLHGGIQEERHRRSGPQYILHDGIDDALNDVQELIDLPRYARRCQRQRWEKLRTCWEGQWRLLSDMKNAWLPTRTGHEYGDFDQRIYGTPPTETGFPWLRSRRRLKERMELSLAVAEEAILRILQGIATIEQAYLADREALHDIDARRGQRDRLRDERRRVKPRASVGG